MRSTNPTSGAQNVSAKALTNGRDPKITEAIPTPTDAGGFDAETFKQRAIAIAVGRNAEDKNWQSKKTTVGELIETCFQEFKQGAKDGRAITQGPLSGVQRKAKAVQSCSILMIDMDTGETMDEIADKIAAQGLYAILWHTYSNGKQLSEIPESKLVALLRKDKDWLRARSPSNDMTVLAEQCADYLRKIKKLAPVVLDGVSGVTKGLTPKGMMFTVHHAPMPRVRALFVLDQPFDFATRAATQDDAIDEWKDR